MVGQPRLSAPICFEHTLAPVRGARKESPLATSDLTAIRVSTAARLVVDRMACCRSACGLSARWDRLFPSDPLRRPSIHPRSPPQPDGVAAPTRSPTMAPCNRDLGRIVLRMALVFTLLTLATLDSATSTRPTPPPAVSHKLPNALSTHLFRISRFFC